MPTPRFPRTAAAFLALAVPFVATQAHATGFLTDQFGNDHGQPALANGFSVYFNPAAMVGMTGSTLTVDGVVAGRSLSFDRSASALSPSKGSGLQNNSQYQQVNTGQAQLFNVLGAPYLGFVTQFGQWRLGAAAYAPFGGSVQWPKISGYQNLPGAPGAVDGPQRWSTISAFTASAYGTLAAAYELPKAHLGVGASVSVISTADNETFAKNVDGSDDTIQPNGAIKEGRAYVDLTGVEVGAAAGVYWEPRPDLHLGASYTSAPNFGTMRLSGTLRLYTPGIGDDTSKGDLLQAYPDVIRAGVSWRARSDAELRFDIAYQRWSQFKNQCFVQPGADCNVNADGSAPNGKVIFNLVHNFQDAARFRLGGAYWVKPETELFGSFAYETSPVSAQNEDPLVFDSQHLQGTLGVRHQFTKHVYAMLAYTYTYYLPVTVTNSALNTYQAPSKAPSENGSYSSELYIFDGSIDYVF